jgi:2-dehydro-3-deoxyphosphogluconate aldolase/(4S)-4-hydroxy-2-oxoglutarate aldolase
MKPSSIDQKQRVLDVLQGQRVIPVIKIENADDTVQLISALVRGGLPAVEITLRTAAALEAITIAARDVKGAIVGAGTVLDKRHFRDCVDAGSRFIVSPGATIELLDIARKSGVPLLPGAITPSEMMGLREEGYGMMKFFPAGQAGGAAFLKALSSPLADISFCPTGGVSLANANDYLSLPNVECVGGSWLVPDDAVAAKDWDRIEQLALEASKL